MIADAKTCDILPPCTLDPLARAADRSSNTQRRAAAYIPIRYYAIIRHDFTGSYRVATLVSSPDHTRAGWARDNSNAWVRLAARAQNHKFHAGCKVGSRSFVLKSNFCHRKRIKNNIKGADKNKLKSVPIFVFFPHQTPRCR